MRLSAFSLLFALGLTHAACSASNDARPPVASDDAGTSGTPDANANDSGVAIPDSPVGQRLAWLLSMIDGGITTAKDAELAAQFTQAFLGAVPTDQLRPVLADEAKRAPHVLVGFEGTPTPSFLIALVRDAAGHLLRITLGTKASEQDKIDSLLLAPAGDAARRRSPSARRTTRPSARWRGLPCWGS